MRLRQSVTNVSIPIQVIFFDTLGKPEYLVKWAGHPETNNSWEPEENLCFVKYLIEEYNANKKHKTASKNVDVQ